MSRPPAFPDGHFYSPVVDVDELWLQQDRIWPPQPEVLGIDFNEAEQRRILSVEFPRYLGDYDYPEQPPGGADASSTQFYSGNSQFSWLDARALFVMLRMLGPRRMIEIGSGFTSLLTADVSRRFLGGRLHFTCIEPYPQPFLLQGVPGITRLIPSKAQDVDLTEFRLLGENDILFVDSSHVSKTGSDINHILFDVLPRLSPGVVIHFHDIFLPNDYPKDWVLEERRSWNEQYLVRALLMYSSALEILFGSAYVFHHFPNLVAAALKGPVMGGGSLWVRVKQR